MNRITEEDLFKSILYTDIYEAIAFFERETDENKEKLYSILIDYITNKMAPKSVEESSKENLGSIDVNMSIIVRALGLLSKEDRIEFLEYTIKNTFEAIDRYYDKYAVSCFNGDDKKIGFLSALSMHNLTYEVDSVFCSKFLLELAHNYFKYLRENEATIDGLIEFSNIMQVNNCLEKLGEMYASGLHKDEALGNDFFTKIIESLEMNLQEGTLNPNYVNSYLKLLKAFSNGENSVLTRNKVALIEKTADIVEALDIMGDETRTEPEIIEKVESRIGDLAEQLVVKCDVSFVNDNVREWVETLLRGIEKNEKTNLTQLRQIGAGAYSNVFSLGEKVIKIGHKNKQFELPRNFRRFLQPIVRMETDGLHFEVSEKVLPVKEEDVTEEELYKIYKELRDADLYLEDFKATNLGRLIKPNEIYVDAIKETGGRPKRSFGPNIGIKKDEDVEVLGPGELVIIDLDYIYPYSWWDKNIIKFPLDGIMKRFSDRYEREKKTSKSDEKDEI